MTVSGEFDVDTGELRSAATAIRTAVAAVGGWTMSSQGASADSFGHDQVAQMYVEMCAKLTETVATAATGSTQAAADVDASATTYDTTDTTNGVYLGSFGQVPGAAPGLVP